MINVKIVNEFKIKKRRLDYHKWSIKVFTCPLFLHFSGAAVESDGRWSWLELDCRQPSAPPRSSLEPSHWGTVLRPHPQDGADQADLHLQVHHQELNWGEDGGDPEQEEGTHHWCLPHWGWGGKATANCWHQEHFRSPLKGLSVIKHNISCLKAISGNICGVSSYLSNSLLEWNKICGKGAFWLRILVPSSFSWEYMKMYQTV